MIRGIPRTGDVAWRLDGYGVADAILYHHEQVDGGVIRPA
jgi:hypothetical protein